MQKILSPNQFLFQEAVLELLKQAKKNIRVQPFQTIQPQEFVKNNNGNLYLNLYHQYFIATMTNIKTKELACIKYQKILRENLFDRDHLPSQMISSILTACAYTGGSTTGSSHGSANISTNNQQNQMLYVVNLIKTILIKTSQNSTQIQLALTYILQGTRNKRFNTFYSSVLEQIYNNLLTKIREQPIKRIVHLQVNHMINQVEHHFDEKNFEWKVGKLDQNGKKMLCVHSQRNGKGKFGKCFICTKQADNYCKQQYVPICSFECKQKLKQLTESQNNNDYFNLMGWLIENLPSGDQIVYSFLGRQLPHQSLGINELISILKIIINVFTTCSAERLAQHTASVGQPNQAGSGHYIFRQIQKHSLNIFLHILFNYKHIYEAELSKYFKVFFFEIVRILELISIKRLKLQSKTSKGSKGQLGASKQSLQSSLNLSIDNMGNMQSMNNMAQKDPNVANYLHYQQQFSNPFLNGIIQILSNEDLFFYIYSKFDCKFFQQNLLAKMMNVISQYAKEEIISKEFGVGITGSSAYGVYSILKMLTERLVGYQKHKNLRTFDLEEENKQVELFLKKYPINQTQVELKRNLPKIIQQFNKKPIKGILALKKLFSKSKKVQKIVQNLSQSTIKMQSHNQSQQFVNQIQNVDYDKDVQEIRRRAEQLERQNLETSRMTMKQQQKLPSIQNMQDSNISEVSKVDKQETVEQVNTHQNQFFQHQNEQIKPQNKIQSQKNQNKQKIQQKQTVEENIEDSPIKNLSNKKQQQKPSSKTPEVQAFITSKQIAILLRQNVDYDSKLKKIPLFHKEKVAQYLGSTKNKEATQICFQFFKLDQPIYKNMEIDDCLRIEFNYFGLPKEGQQIQIVIDELSKVMLEHTYFKSSLNIFQYIYTLLMVQSGHNPNVKQNDKVKLEMFLSMVSHIEEAKGKAERDFHRIKQNSLNNHFNWGQMIFDRKYVMNLSEEDFVFQKLEQSKGQVKQSADIINLKWLMQYVWEYVYISIVNNQKKNSTLGVFEAIVLYGKYGLVGEQFGFMQIFKRSYEYNKAKQSLQSLLRLGIEFNNYLYQWSYIINLSYMLEQSNTYHQHIDKIFTNLQFVHKSKLKIFLNSLCEFSTSEYKSDKGYNRELFVLRHITEILQYNLSRLQSVWDQIWSSIEIYFKGICLHPKKQISMAAIDSYKQLSLKIFKLKSSSQIKIKDSQLHSPINHRSVLETYLYIFERSNIFIKDLIINILQNVVSNDISSGWEIIYEILNINDSQDKTVVMKVVQRLVNQVGYQRLTSLQRLHMILIKQLRVNVGTTTLIELILTRLWEVSQTLNQRQIWLETMKSIKDIYKMSLNNKLLVLFFKICNKCITVQTDQIQERKRRQSFDSMKIIVPRGQGQKLQVKVEQKQQQQKIQKIQQKQQKQISIDRLIYTEIVDWLIFLIDNKNIHSNDSADNYILILKEALQHFKAVRSQYIIRYLVGVSGLLNIFSMFINSDYQIVFLLFFRDFFKQKLLENQQKLLLIRKSPEKYVELMSWINEHFKQSRPSDLLAMRKLDEDFKKQRRNLLYSDDNYGSQIPLVQSQTHKIQLIQFSLSAKDFNIKSISNLILLDCIETTIKPKHLEILTQKINQLKSQKQIQSPPSSPKLCLKQNYFKILHEIYQGLIQNFEISRKTNNLIALRNFLWNNGFLLYNTFKDNGDKIEINNQQQNQANNNTLINIAKELKVKAIPGLHKHEKRTLEIILRNLPDEDSYVLEVQILEDFITNYRVKSCLEEEKSSTNGLKKRKHKQSANRIRKISEVLKLEHIEPENKVRKQSTSSNRKKSVQNNEKKQESTNKQSKQEQSQSRQRKQSVSSNKNKQIKVIQFEKKVSKSSQPKVQVVSNKNEKSLQTQTIMKQLYLNDVNEWIKMMENNLNLALQNLLRICTNVVEKQEGSNEDDSFLLKNQELIKIFLLCLDLSGEENSSLTILRSTSSLMQKLLKSVLSLQIEYGWRQQEDIQNQIQQDKNE